MQGDGKTLNQTFIPKSMLRKTQFKTVNTLTQKNNFDKTHGNIYVQLDPPQIKFNGYEINKINTLSFKIINKAPIPQRFNILPPTESHFAIKVNKKGNIPTGMYETVQVTFKATEYKYLYDVVKINTQTENFVVPLYAYPTIPNLNTIFPKLIDFGNIQLKQSQSFYYPIKNPTPIDFKFQFVYKKQCAEIMINPLTGLLPGNAETIVEMSFIPNRKVTYLAEVYFKIQQFDFEPIYIQVMGSGKEREMTKTFKRLKSSRLVPIKQKQEDVIAVQKQKDRMMTQTQAFLNDKLKDQPQRRSFVSNVRKISSKITYPKLLNSTIRKEKTLVKGLGETLQGNISQKSLTASAVYANDQQRKYISRFNKVAELDKQKDIKFAQFLGDKAMTQPQLQHQRSLTTQMLTFRHNLLRTQCETRCNPQKSDFPQIEYKILHPQSVTWDENKNDHVYERRAVLNKFVIAASRVIAARRIEKRFEKIKQFLSDCGNSKVQVAKKVDISHQKSLDSHALYGFKVISFILSYLQGDIDLNFTINSLQPSYFQMQFTQGKQQTLKSRVFKAEGKPEFDDLKELELNEECESEKMAYGGLGVVPQHVYLSKAIPQQRVSGEQQFSLKSSSLPSTYQPIQLLSIVSKPFQIPNHYFIHQKQQYPLFKQTNPIDEKDPRFLFAIDQPIEDEFQGWAKGEFELLKAKLMRNTGVEYRVGLGYNYAAYGNDVGFEGDITKNLSRFIEKPLNDDHIEQDDSDDEKYDQQKPQRVQQFLQKIQTNLQVKARRAKKQIQDEQKKASEKIEKNLGKDKFKKVSKYIEKAANFNKMVEKPQNLILT